MKLILFNLTFYPLFIICTFVMVVGLTIPMFILHLFIGWQRTVSLVRHEIRWYGWLIARGLTFPFVKIIYQDFEETNQRPACIYVVNHRSSSDAFLMFHIKEEVVQVVNKWPFKIPLIGWVANLAEYLDVRSMPFSDFEARCLKLLNKGVSIVAFPEGSRSKDARVKQFNSAVFRVAIKANVAIIPICLSGNQMIPDRETGILHPGKIHVHKMNSVQPEDYKDMSSFKLKNHVRALIQNEVNRLENHEIFV